MRCNLVPVPLLEKLASGFRNKEPDSGSPKSHSLGVSPSQKPKRVRNDFNLEAWMFRYLPDAEGPRPLGGGGSIWVLPQCLFRPGDGDSMFIVQRSNGAISAGCQHSTCPGSKTTGNHWKEIRSLMEGSASRIGLMVDEQVDMELATLPRTEFGLCERFRRRFGEICRFIETWDGRWLVYDGHRWELSNAAAEIFAQETIYAIGRETKYLTEDDNEEHRDRDEEPQVRTSSVGAKLPEGEPNKEPPGPSQQSSAA